MAVGLSGTLPPLLAVRGIRVGATAAGVRKAGRLDLVVIEIESGSDCAAVFTRNAFCAAPVTVARRNLALRMPRYLLINTGNANAGTGAAGLRGAEECCSALAAQAGCDPAEVLPFSTGVIGEPLPVDRIVTGIPAARAALRADGWNEAATGIMTTDTVPKGVSRSVQIAGHTVTITGIAKGAGMIHPNMATMLAFIATDARVRPELLQSCLLEAVDVSFNSITVDGDTSTNDACVLIATGASSAPPLVSDQDAHYPLLRDAVAGVCAELAQAIVRDAEGVTKFITVEVVQGRDPEECRAVANAVALSPLVKTAFFASDPNWGRILAAVGRSGLSDLDVDAVSVYLDEVCIVRGGGRAPDYTEERGREVMQRSEITIRIELARGQARACVWTCDFSYDYVRINAEYRT
ncbi:MAG: bifunctional glutamate N-acetyltransferase/amino-acid acetyltransferase ArgJ [Gammaproteobacteria bacterium]|nr:bifunctional glutamate N-acetyltransferase/amino-acid acetyltransferase ArgJ [Gammaproteobacteria bacterium]